MFILNSFNKKSIKNILIFFFVVTLFFGYIYSIYLDIQKGFEKYIEKSLVLKYEIYTKLLNKNTTPISFLVENPYYIDKSELIDEMRKSTPLMAEIDKEKEAKFDVTFKFFTQNKKEAKEFQKFKKKLDPP